LLVVLLELVELLAQVVVAVHQQWVETVQTQVTVAQVVLVQHQALQAHL
jgi:hypothetical protein